MCPRINTADIIMQNIEKDYRWVEDCFEAMLNHWVKRSPLPSRSAVVRALKSPTIGREDIATSIKVCKIIKWSNYIQYYYCLVHIALEHK